MPGLGLLIPDTGRPPPGVRLGRVDRGSLRVTATKSATNMIKTMKHTTLPVAAIVNSQPEAGDNEA